ncbi:helix-turn-helix domain-containing protein [Sphingomonas histidinilytica]|uniref:AraC family transcriptional regulator n=1 Tax=Sphingomonadales TaxID=204457 RepID=UPI0007701863|nr:MULTISPECIES: helix-turn-helix transcriptional regulator [Sphingomonadaceae]AMK22893.1 AraC family transcriptional regulator [Sphingobium sp. TKS]MBO9380702.1 helix-turn-helix domain-containing protein [Rhizorhabdus histidinilytica]MCF8706638.1 helix-turn-helix transcriptional regulator [Rhizorhapis sp. SPR117]
MHRHPDDHEDVPRPVVGIGNDYPPSFELAEHKHRRVQLLYAASGVIAVSTPDGAWVAPPERAVWIPGGTPHATRMVGAVQTRSVLIEPRACRDFGRSCRVVAISPLLRQLLLAAAVVPLEYDEVGRDGLVMKLLVAELEEAPVIPLAVPFPREAKLAAQCHLFLERPQATATIDQWADVLAMNRRRFTRLFRRETGMSFAEWRQQACLSVALPRLAAGESVTAIALDLGYDSPANFSTMFRRILGVPPSRYLP